MPCYRQNVYYDTESIDDPSKNHYHRLLQFVTNNLTTDGIDGIHLVNNFYTF